MTTDLVKTSPLDKLLRQSLDALARTEAAKADVAAGLMAVLAQIAFNFRFLDSVAVHTIVDPASTELRLNGQLIKAPRLLVQCTWRDAPLTAPLTFVYTPTRTDCIAMQVTYGNVTHHASDCVEWNPHHGWHIPAHGHDLDAATHADFLRAALQSSGLFSAAALSLEPIAN
jgi:hypothetical protein